ncbi:MAG TPA: hypothetical protein VKV21_17325, partial [Solirubrobacteraceae bacterium]|nr:hypothetical protein [Solirubrobacteraceae bacterium]
TRTLGPVGEAMIAKLASGLNTATALASQQQQQVTSHGGQVTLNTGVLGQYPPASDSPTNFTYGWGMELLSAGMGSAPVMRLGSVTWALTTATTTTLAQAAAAGASTIETAASIAAGSWILIDQGNGQDICETTAVSGAGPYTLTLQDPLRSAHAAGATVIVLSLRQIDGQIWCDANGLCRQVWDTSGATVYDTSGNATQTIISY